MMVIVNKSFPRFPFRAVLFRAASALGVLAGTSIAVQAQQVTVTPQYPQRGQQVTITYTPGVKQPATAVPQLVFTYSNLYELPWQLPLQKTAGGWQVSFPLQRYATYATFFIKDGNDTIRPVAGRHYPLAVYRADSVPVKNGRLYESYSLTAQMGRSSQVPQLQRQLLEHELADYPDNYEATVRLYLNRLSRAPEAEKAAIREKAYAYIAGVFEKDPVANMNLATMGYLIMGDNRNDSVYRIIRERYPQTAMGTEMRISLLTKEKNSAAVATLLEKEVAAATPLNRGALQGAHEWLFEYYVQHRQAQKALWHARESLSPQTPYLPRQVMDIAAALALSAQAPDTALYYALRSRELAVVYPAGLIRYFKETGYIPGYVSDSARAVVQQKARAGSMALVGIAYASKGNRQRAALYLDSALATGTDETTLQYAAVGFERLQQYEKAWLCNRQQLLQQTVTDTATIQAARLHYGQWKGDSTGFAAAWQQIQQLRGQQVKQQLKQQLLHAAAPSLAGMVTMAGKPVLPDTLKGKILVIDFWATWCIPCMQEMPYLQKVYDHYKNNPKVQFMVVNSGARNTLADAQNWFGNKKYSFPVYFHTNAAVGEVFGFTVIPALYVIDASGKLQYKHIGFEGPQVEEHLKALIDVLSE